MTKDQAKEAVLELVPTWPENRQQELVEAALEIEAEIAGAKYDATTDELAAIDEGCSGRAAIEEEIKATFPSGTGAAYRNLGDLDVSAPTDSPEHRSSVEVTGIPDLDRPLYRIFPLWFFEYALRVNGGCLVLVPPRVWEDPYEDLCARIMMSAPDHSQKGLAGYLRPTYAQCWSFEGQSDALLRAYSRVTRDHITHRNVEPKYEGVQVITTPQKLVSALNSFSNKRKDPDLTFYLGAVEYVTDFFTGNYQQVRFRRACRDW